MNLSDIAIIVGSLVLGYLVVSFLMGGKKPSQTPDATRTSGPEQAPPAATTTYQTWAEVLDVSPAASGKEIQAAYRKKMSEYHPDKVATLGQELRELAERKSKDIDAAYTRAKLERGFE
jgi:DnaJ-domain-containing protein 1